MSDAEENTKSPDEPSPERKPDAQGGAEPFRRGAIVWGRPPQNAFHVGPLPRDEGLARLVAMPPHPKPVAAKPAQAQPQRSAQPSLTQPRPAPSGVFSGSMVPRRSADAAPLSPAPLPAENPARQAEALAGKVAPLADVSAPAPAPAEAVANVSSPEITEAPKPSLIETPPGAVAGSVVERPTQSRSRWPVYAGLAGVAVVAALVWMINRADKADPATQPVMVPNAPVDAAPPSTVPMVEPLPAVEQPATPVVVPAREAPAAAVRVAEPPVPARRPAPSPQSLPRAVQPQTPASPMIQVPAAPVALPAQIVVTPSLPAQVTAQATGPAPTEAQPAPTDPNAPIITRPRKLD